MPKYSMDMNLQPVITENQFNEKRYQNSTNTIPINLLSKHQYDMIVFCHLRWDFVYQRPQHLISRISKERKVLYVEEPVHFEPNEKNAFNLIEVNKKLTILQPRVEKIEDIGTLLHNYLGNNIIAFGWFYSASFVPILNQFLFEKIIYDCMDELSLFRGANPQIVAQEKYLLSKADIVFTGGKSLYEAKKIQHKNVFCFPSSVDRHHFEKALNGILKAPDLPIGKPIIGYYGVIDERIDFNLIEKAASQLPLAAFVLIGPIAKLNLDELPKAHNIYYLGMRPYSELPNYLKGFDIAMMPFAINDATKFISPTKTLEYMAARKPVISTPVYDVVRDYNHCLSIVNNADSFVDAVKNILSSDYKVKANRNKIFGEILNNTSWDLTASKMITIIEKTLQYNEN